MDKRSHTFTDEQFRQLKRDCKKKLNLYVDHEFPPSNDSLFLDKNRSADIVWMRPGELCDDPHLFVEGASPNDVTQGILGNCWFVSACSALTHNTALLEKVIPNATAQEYDQDYSGMFLFQFWRFGEWIQIIIDDLLPTKDGKLLFARSKTPNEFWSALLEKAFAKLYGCYENLVGGQLADALQDVSGGVAETINVKKYFNDDLNNSPHDLFELLQLAFDQEALIVAAIAAKAKEDIETSLDCGLVVGHAYAVTAVRYITLDVIKEVEINFEQSTTSTLFASPMRKMMIRLQNPWGEKEWNGPWADDSEEWEQVTDAQKHELGITVDEDGEFWMPWDEFIRYFTDISVCQLFNTTAAKYSPVPLSYHEFMDDCCWTTNGVKLGAPEDRSGGCANFPGTFCLNPQYLFEVKNENEDVMLALTQEEIKPLPGHQREPFITIGMHVMKVEINREHRIHQAINPIATSDYIGSRSIYLHLKKLSIGRYIVIPTTYAPREQAKFLIRIYSAHDLHARLLIPDYITKKSVLHSILHSFVSLANIDCSSPPKTVARISIMEFKFDVVPPQKLSVTITGEKLGKFSTPFRYPKDLDDSFIICSTEVVVKLKITVHGQDEQGKVKVWAKGVHSFNNDNDCVEESVKLMTAKKTADLLGHLNLKISAYDDPYYL